MKVFCVKVLGARFIHKDQEYIEENAEACFKRYAVVKIGKQRHKTEHQLGSIESVEWGDTFQFDSEKIPKETEIVVEVYIKWFFSKEFVGDIHLAYSQHKVISFENAYQHWFPLKLKGSPTDSRMKAEVGLVMGYIEIKDKKASKVEVRPDITANRRDEDPTVMMEEAVEIARENTRIVQRILEIENATIDNSGQNLQAMSLQTENVQRIHREVENIELTLIASEDPVKNIESCWSMFCGFSSSKRRVKKQKNIRAKAKRRAMEERAKEEKRRAKKLQKEEKENKRKLYNPKPVPQAGKKVSELLETPAPSMVAVTQEDKEWNKLRRDLKEETKKCEEGLEKVHDKVKIMKEEALSIRDNLDQDIANLKDIDTITTKNKARLNRQHHRTARLT